MMDIRDTFAAGVDRLRSLPAAVRFGVVAGWWLTAVGVVALVYDIPTALLSGTVALCSAVLLAAHKRRHADTSVRDFLRSFVDLRRPSLRHVALAAVGVATIIAAEILLAVVHGVVFPATSGAIHDVSQSVPSAELWAYAVLFAWVAGVGPFLEELVFRNGIQKLLAYRIRPAAAIAITSGAFALLHVPSYGGFGAPLVALALPVGVVFTGSAVFGVLYWRTENVAVPTLAHMGFNAAVLLMSVA